MTLSVRPSIRARLTLWYTGVLVLALLVQGLAVYVLQQQLAVRELDAEVRQDLETVNHSVAAEFAEGMPWQDAVADALRETLLPERQIAVFCGDTLLGARPQGAGAWLREAPVDGLITRAADDGGRWRAGARTTPSPMANCRVAVARSMKPVQRTRDVALRAVWTGLILAAVVAAIGGFWLARRALRPLTRLAAECEAIPALGGAAPAGAGLRLTLPGTRDELDRVVEAFNALLGRLEQVLETQRQFMADASHELRTPVSVVRSAAEVALSRERRDAAEYRDAMEVVAAQSHRMTRLVEDLFLLARVDAGQRPLTRARVYLDDLLRECVSALAVLARARGVTIEAAVEPDVEVDGDEHLLRQLLVNVLQNAVAYTRPGSHVAVRLQRSGERVDIAVTDAGPGVPPEFQARIFERFVRLPHHTARDHGDLAGGGLGLAIARVIAELHGGTVALRATGSSGSTFAITLPAARDVPGRQDAEDDGRAQPEPADDRERPRTL